MLEIVAWMTLIVAWLSLIVAILALIPHYKTYEQFFKKDCPLVIRKCAGCNKRGIFKRRKTIGDYWHKRCFDKFKAELKARPKFTLRGY